MKLKLEIKIKDIIKYSIEAIIVTFWSDFRIGINTIYFTKKRQIEIQEQLFIKITEELDNNILKI